jgi:serine/threonine-protein kinase
MGRYSAIASLGQGGMANVFLALMAGPAGFNKLLVLKVLREDIDANRSDLAAMFLDEARLAARLQHRNVVQTNEFGEIDGQYYMVMEFLEGQTLRALQRKVASIPLPDQLRIIAETARGLDYAHDLKGLRGEPLNVVHRDISPQNVFVTYDGQVKLLDFGIAKVEGAEHLTQLGVIKGKIDYIAPEQVRGEKIDRRADVFSLGAMLWEAITSERFGGTKIPEVTKFHNRLTGGEPKIRTVVPGVPEELASIVDEAIALDPNVRMPSAGALADRIEAYLATLAVRPNEKSLGNLVAAAFQEERAQMRKIIDEQCKNVVENTPVASRQALDLRLVKVGVPDLSTPGTGSHTREPIISSLPKASPGKAASKRRSAVLMLLGGSAVAIAVAVALGLANKRDAADAGADARKAELAPEAAPSLPPPQVAPAQLPATAQPSAAERSITLSIDVTPRDARVLLDNVPLPSLPFSGSFQTSGALHRLEVSADGYQAANRFLKFDANQELKIELHALPQARGRPKRASPGGADAVQAQPAKAESAPQSASPRDEDAPGAPMGGKARSRGFDSEDPYAE